MIELLTTNPDKVFQLTNNEEAKTLMYDLGISGRFSASPHGGIESIQSIVFNENSTHHIIGLLYTGYATKEENGYMAFCFPKSRMTPERFTTVVKEVLASTSARPTGVKFFSGESPDN